jgi:hypothetical protein
MSGELRFAGRIAGFGTASGTRVVLGMWQSSPFGRFADAMIEDAGGHRLLLAPSERVAEFVASTYRFDEVRVVPVRFGGIAGGIGFVAGGAAAGRAAREPGARGAEGAGVDGVGVGMAGAAVLAVRIRVGEVSPLGRVLRAVPARLATSPVWLRAVDPVAAALVPGVRTAGSAGGGRHEYYGVTTLRRIAWAEAAFEGRDLGAFAPLHPPVRFGFGSAPPDPHLVDLVTVVRGGAADAPGQAPRNT